MVNIKALSLQILPSYLKKCSTYHKRRVKDYFFAQRRRKLIINVSGLSASSEDKFQLSLIDLRLLSEISHVPVTVPPLFIYLFILTKLAHSLSPKFIQSPASRPLFLQI